MDENLLNILGEARTFKNGDLEPLAYFD